MMKTFLRLLGFLAPFRWQVALAVLLGVLMVASNIGLLSMAAYLIAAAAIVPFLILLTLPVTIVRFMGVLRPTSRYAERLVSHNVTFRLLAHLRTRVYSKLEPLAPAHLLTYRSGDMLARLVTDVDELQNVYLRILSPLLVALLICGLTFGLFSIFSMLLAWVALAFLMVTGVALPISAGLLTRGLGKQQLELRATQKAQLVDSIQGIQDILAYGQAETQQQKVQDLDHALAQVLHKMALIAGLQEALNDLLMNLALWTILVLAIPLVISQAINAVYLGLLCFLMLASFEAIQPLAQAFQLLGHSLAAGERLFGIMDAPPTVVENPTPAALPEAAAGYTLEMAGVHFTYPAAENAALQDICFQIPAGKRVAVVGSSGAGKSTLVRLLLRFWDPTQGTIRLNGQDIRGFALEDLRSLIGVVAQDTYLFNSTLRGNLLLAKPDASEQELQQALQQARLDEFVQQLPAGLDTWIGEQGLRLSGGERQRLAIARALLKDAPLLILDEATANLDPLTERAVLDTLDSVMQGRTTLLITHRLIAMERMDEILVLKQGQLQEHGTHEQLFLQNGLYRQMFDLQNGMLTAFMEGTGAILPCDQMGLRSERIGGANPERGVSGRNKKPEKPASLRG